VKINGEGSFQAPVFRRFSGLYQAPANDAAPIAPATAVQTQIAFQPPAPYLADEKEHRKQLARAILGALQGKLNATLTVTLNKNASSTTIIDQRIGAYSFVWPMPMNADAGAELATGNVYFDTFKSGANAPGSFLFHHTNNGEADRQFRLLIIG